MLQVNFGDIKNPPSFCMNELSPLKYMPLCSSRFPDFSNSQSPLGLDKKVSAKESNIKNSLILSMLVQLPSVLVV